MQKQLNIPVKQARIANFMAVIGALYSFYALYSSGETAVMLGSIATFFGWTLFGIISNKNDKQKLKHA